MSVQWISLKDITEKNFSPVSGFFEFLPRHDVALEIFALRVTIINQIRLCGRLALVETSDLSVCSFTCDVRFGSKHLKAHR